MRDDWGVPVSLSSAGLPRAHSPSRAPQGDGNPLLQQQAGGAGTIPQHGPWREVSLGDPGLPNLAAFSWDVPAAKPCPSVPCDQAPCVPALAGGRRLQGQF